MNNPIKQNITFQLDKTTISKLRELSRAEAIPPDMLINQMLIQYLGQRSAFTISEYMPVRRVLLMKLLEKFTEKEVASIAKSIARASTKKIILRLRQEHNVMTSIDVVESLIRISNYKYKHDVNYGIHSFTIQHNLGKKWAVYLYEIYSSVLRQFKFKKIEINVSDKQLIFTVIMKIII